MIEDQVFSHDDDGTEIGISRIYLANSRLACESLTIRMNAFYDTLREFGAEVRRNIFFNIIEVVKIR